MKSGIYEIFTAIKETKMLFFWKVDEKLLRMKKCGLKNGV